MPDEKKGWDEIPSLDGLQVDWDYTADTPLGKRRFERLTVGDVTSIFEIKVVSVRVATSHFTIDGRLSDISGDGIAIMLKKRLEAGQHVKMGFFLGTQKIVTKAIVRQVTSVANGYKTGMQFHEMDSGDASYINSLYASKVLTMGKVR